MNKVLIIDDCQIICDIIKGALEIDGVNCSSCHSGEEAKKLIMENRYSTVFLDINLPQTDTLVLASFIRKKSLLTQIIIISGNIDDDTFYQFVNLGVYDFFLKNKLAIADLQKAVSYGSWRQGRLASLFPEIK